MGSTHAHVPSEEQAIYRACQVAVQGARSNLAKKQDPTKGATHFNFRNGSSQAAFQGYSILTSVGRLNNSYPTVVLPATNIYANTYK